MRRCKTVYLFKSSIGNLLGEENAARTAYVVKAAMLMSLAVGCIWRCVDWTITSSVSIKFIDTQYHVHGFS